ncbi:uncharacterized protein LOC132953272 [Metopolophium dirhodum]|uniref:uncharacterized protein LOC132953262 n=1 Tax=Metopolophium dirhodum TaxID=44670 RepID=UPI00298FCE7F|nr:uncharacterized protein LOC132953262 [Metopolophium dirhodum]XP_060881775.1 uncharacterized protein LOC132953272 [Metopolophium dirhodum]
MKKRMMVKSVRSKPRGGPSKGAGGGDGDSGGGRDRQCYNCGKHGHMSRDCAKFRGGPSKRGGGGGRGRDGGRRRGGNRGGDGGRSNEDGLAAAEEGPQSDDRRNSAAAKRKGYISENVVTERLCENDNDAVARVCEVYDRGTSVENGESVDDTAYWRPVVDDGVEALE